MDLGFNLAQSNQDLKDPTSRQIFGDTSGLLCKNDLIPCLNTFISLIFRGLGEKAGLVRKRIICWGRKTVFRPPGLHKTSLTVGAKNRDMS